MAQMSSALNPNLSPSGRAPIAEASFSG